MTVNTENIYSGPYVGNDISDTFSYGFRIQDETQLNVYETDDAGNRTLLDLTTDYTVTGVDNDLGGTITLVAGALPSGYEIFIEADYPATQDTAFASQGRFNPKIHEDALDKLTFLIKQLQYALTNTVQFSPGYVGASPVLPDPEAGDLIRWTEDGIEGITVGEILTEVTTVIADLSINGYRITGLGNAIANTDAVAYKQLLDLIEEAQIGSNTIVGTDSLVTTTGTSTPRKLGDRFADVINAIDEGAVSDGVTNNTESLEQMQAKNKNDAIELSKGGYVIDSDAKIEDVIYKGKGVFVTKNSPNIATSGLSSTLGLFSNGVIPERHLRRTSEAASRGDTVKVMIIGDSLSTPYVGADLDMNGSPDCLWGYLKRRVQRLNVNTKFEFINRGIGAKTFSSVNSSQFGSVPSNINWYTEDKPWIDYIVDESPDLVFISFGMNDRENIVIPQFALMMQTLLSMQNVPDIVFCTNMVPSRMSDNDNISSEKSNEGRDFSAGYIRHYAQTADFGLIDVNRHFHLVMDGTDIENTYMCKVADGPTSIPYIGPSTALCSNFTFKLEMASLESGVLNDLNVEGGERLRIQTSPEQSANNPNSSSYIEIGTRGGYIAVEVNDNVGVGWNPNKFGVGVGGYGYTNYTTDTLAPIVGSQCDIYVTVKGANLIVSLNNQIILDVLIRRLGQVFRPKVLFKNSSVTQPVQLTLYQGRYAKICHPLLTSSEIWDDLESNGGNGLNHPNTKATALIYGPVIDSTNLSIPPICVGSTNYPSTMGNRKTIGGNRAKGSLTLGALADDSPLIDTLPVPTANNVVLVGSGNSVGETVLVPDAGAYVKHITTETEQGSLSESYVPASGIRKTAIKGEDVLTLLIPQNDSFVGAQLLCKIGGVLTLKQVYVGGADSGGAGFRMLRVTN